MSSLLEAQRAHLDAVVRWAAQIHTHLADVQRGRADVHFRPGAGGVSMVGLLPERPQRGRSQIRDLPRLARELDAQFAEHCRDVAQGRPTPEKRLQSYLVSNAYAHRRRMSALEPPDHVLTFVTDEIVVRPLNEDGSGRIVCDILALRRVEGGEVPVVMELKSERAMTELIRQGEAYASLVARHREVFERLFAATLGREVRFSGAPEKWIVWPALRRRGRRDDELRRRGFTVVEYTETAGGFELGG